MNVHATDDLKTYPLPAQLVAHLRQVDSVAQVAARRGDVVPPCIVIQDTDYATADRIVRLASGGRLSMATAQWNGRRVVPASHASAA